MKTLLMLLLCVSSVRGAVVFDGTDDIIGFGVAGDTIFNEDQPFTFSCWYSAVDDGESNAGTFIRRGGNIFRITSINALRFSTGSLLRVANSASFITNFPNQLICTWDATTNASGVHIYVNGVECSYVTSTDGVIGADNSADPVTIGSNAALTTTFRGTLSEVAVWNSVLSAAQIQSFFRSRVHYYPLQVAPSTIVAYWPLDDFSDLSSLSGTDTVKDRSSKLRDGSATNGPTARASTIISYP